MIACLPPSDRYLDENISTLTYATKASYISNEPNKNEDPRMKIIHELRKKINALEKELKAANDHIAVLTSLSGGVGGLMPQKNQLFNEGRPSLLEREVTLNEKVPLSTQKGDSTAGGDEELVSSETIPRDLALQQQKSTPNNYNTKIDEDGYKEDFKSDNYEGMNKTAGTTKKPKKKAKNIAGLGGSKP